MLHFWEIPGRNYWLFGPSSAKYLRTYFVRVTFTLVVNWDYNLSFIKAEWLRKKNLLKAFEERNNSNLFWHKYFLRKYIGQVNKKIKTKKELFSTVVMCALWEKIQLFRSPDETVRCKVASSAHAASNLEGYCTVRVLPVRKAVWESQTRQICFPKML